MAIKICQADRLAFLPFLGDLFDVLHHPPGGEQPHGPPLEVFSDIRLGLRWVDVFARSLRIQQGQTPDDKTKNNASTVVSGEQKNKTIATKCSPRI